ncbi:MAG: DUF6273 domain-containing protein [bacterium]|nr:DUF6273 domain-containing protein [bacterium]
MKKIKIGFFVGSLLLGLSLVGCSKKTTKNTTTAKSNTTTKTNTTTKNTTTTKKVEKVNVIFDSNGGSPVDSQSIEKGTYVTKPNDPTKDGCTFSGWYYEGEEWNFSSSKVMDNITLTAKWKSYVRDGNKIYFGYYPQTLESDDEINAILNSTVGTPEDGVEGYTWIDYGYPAKNMATVGMYYIDLDTDGDDKFDYRGVYYINYRPNCYNLESQAKYTTQDDYGYLPQTTYWFKYEAVEWFILYEENNEALVISNLILDAQDYYPSESQYEFDHNNGKGYANNYELSNIRKWLNDNFYNCAFGDLQKELIKNITVDNSGTSSNVSENPYASNDTDDNVFLLSVSEFDTYFTGDMKQSAKAVGTDYAKSQGLYRFPWDGEEYAEYKDKSSWRLRTPIANEAFRAEAISSFGYYENGYADSANVGIRPSIVIKL